MTVVLLLINMDEESLLSPEAMATAAATVMHTRTHSQFYPRVYKVKGHGVNETRKTRFVVFLLKNVPVYKC